MGLTRTGNEYDNHSDSISISQSWWIHRNIPKKDHHHRVDPQKHQVFLHRKRREKTSRIIFGSSLQIPADPMAAAMRLELPLCSCRWLRPCSVAASGAFLTVGPCWPCWSLFIPKPINHWQLRHLQFLAILIVNIKTITYLK